MGFKKSVSQYCKNNGRISEKANNQTSNSETYKKKKLKKSNTTTNSFIFETSWATHPHFSNDFSSNKCHKSRYRLRTHQTSPPAGAATTTTTTTTTTEWWSSSCNKQHAAQQRGKKWLWVRHHTTVSLYNCSRRII